MNRLAFRVIAVLVVLLPLALPLGAGAEGDVNVIFSGAKVEEGKFPTSVKMAISVVNGQGAPVKGLDKSAFSVTEAGRAVPVESATLVTGDAQAPVQIPLQVALIMDLTGSMAERFPGTNIIPWNIVRPAAEKFVSGLRPDDDVCVFGFNEQLIVPKDSCAKRGADAQVAKNAINRLAPQKKWTAIYDSLYDAANEVAKAYPNGNRAIVLFTDGAKDEGPNGRLSGRSVDNVTVRLRELRIPVIVVGLGQEDAPDFRTLSTLARDSGGLAVRADSPSEQAINKAFADANDRLMSHYVVTYTTDIDDGSYRVDVGVKTAGGSATSTGAVVVPAQPVAITLRAQPEGSSIRMSVTSAGQRKAINATRVEFAFKDDKGVETKIDTRPGDAASTVWDRRDLPDGQHALIARLMSAQGAKLQEVQTQPVEWRKAVIPTATPSDAEVKTRAALVALEEQRIVDAEAQATVTARNQAVVETQQRRFNLVVLAAGIFGVVVLAILALMVAAYFSVRRKIARGDLTGVGGGPIGTVTRVFQEAKGMTRNWVRPGQQTTKRAPEEPLGYLEVLDGPSRGAKFPIRGRSSFVGRGDEGNQIGFSPEGYPEISRRHAEIIVQDGKVQVRDVQSTHGTFVLLPDAAADGQGTRLESDKPFDVPPGATVFLADVGCRIDVNRATIELNNFVVQSKGNSH